MDVLCKAYFKTLAFAALKFTVKQFVSVSLIYILWADVNECGTPAGRCHHSGHVCKNTIGSFMCVCQPGYQQIGADEECRGKLTYIYKIFIWLHIEFQLVFAFVPLK